MVKMCLLLLLPFVVAGERPKPPNWLVDSAGALQTYRQNLAQVRPNYPTTDGLPNLKFFLFGMGDRMKLIYRSGRLLNARTGNIERQWEVQEEIIVPSEYTVQLTLRVEPDTPPRSVQIREDETGVWILQTDKRPRLIRGTRSPLSLPRFERNPAGPVLRVLLQEVLINVVDGQPLTNLFVYRQLIADDATPMLEVLRMSGNANLVDGKKYVAPDSVKRDSAKRRDEISGVDYPLSWQRNAPGAHYPGLTVLEKTLVKQRLLLPQAGHAADLFLHLSGRQ